jgi:glycosyltransferase involved in cell wall biosynthesis
MSKTGKKVVLFANTDWYLYNFRKGLRRALRDAGHDVLLVSPPGDYVDRLQGDGFRWECIDLDPGGMNPLTDFRTVSEIIRLYRAERPTVAHHFTIKCVLYGTIAARRVGGISVVNAVTGLGHVFTDPGIRARVLRVPVGLAYRFGLKADHVRTIFQNDVDRQEFLQRGFLAAETSQVIRGSGVDCTVFTPNNRDGGSGRVRVLFASRLLREKGVYEYLGAAEELHRRGIEAEFCCAGEIYEGNPSSLSSDEIRRLERRGVVRFLGHVDDMIGLLRSSDLVVLPSHREGTPRILLEAAATGLPMVGTDIPGCRGVVEHGVNGLLVQPGDTAGLARAMERLILDQDLRHSFGLESRRIAKADFEERAVIDRTLRVYDLAIGRSVFCPAAGATAGSESAQGALNSSSVPG